MKSKWPIIEVNAHGADSMPVPYPTKTSAHYMLTNVYYMWNDDGPLLGLAMHCTALKPHASEPERFQINVPMSDRNSDYFKVKPVWLDALFVPFEQGRAIEV